MKLSIIICVFNEVSTIEKLINKIINVNLPNDFNKEFVIIDNNSNDGTKEILKKYTSKNNFKIIFNNHNYGKGYSISKGIQISSGDLIVFQDADLEYDPNDYLKLIKHLLKNNLDFVYGSRILNNKKYHRYNIHKYVVVFYTALINYLYGAKFTDTATNYKMFNSKIIKNIKLSSNSFAIDFEVTIKLIKKKYKYDEVPISYFPRTYKEGKKINLLDAFKSLLIIIRLIF